MTLDIVDYDAGWPARFAAASAGIQAALGASVALRVEHIGSTSVPGLAAKPVIDVQVSVPILADLDGYRPGLESLGFRHRPHPEVHDREFFRPDGPRTIHVHVVEEGSAAERLHLMHRDYLRSVPEAAAGYAAVKRTLAGLHRFDRQAYQMAKDPYVGNELTPKAEVWAAASGWRLSGGARG